FSLGGLRISKSPPKRSRMREVTVCRSVSEISSPSYPQPMSLGLLVVIALSLCWVADASGCQLGEASADDQDPLAAYDTQPRLSVETHGLHGGKWSRQAGAAQGLPRGALPRAPATASAGSGRVPALKLPLILQFQERSAHDFERRLVWLIAVLDQGKRARHWRR